MINSKLQCACEGDSSSAAHEHFAFCRVSSSVAAVTRACHCTFSWVSQINAIRSVTHFFWGGGGSSIWASSSDLFLNYLCLPFCHYIKICVHLLRRAGYLTRLSRRLLFCHPVFWKVQIINTALQLAAPSCCLCVFSSYISTTVYCETQRVRDKI